MRLQLVNSYKDETRKVVELLSTKKSEILHQWVDVIREDFKGTENTSDIELLDHISVVLDFLIDQLQLLLKDHEQYDPTHLNFPFSELSDKSKSGGRIHGKQRATIDAYNVDKVYREYIHLREVLIDLIADHQLLNIVVFQVVTSVIETCTRESLKTFTQSVQRIQRKLLGSLVHDIRGPLNIISLTTDLISIEKTVSNIPAHTKIQKASIERMSGMLEEMLQTISVEGGQGLDLYFEDTNLASVLDKIAADTTMLYGHRFVYKNAVTSCLGAFDGQAMSRVFENIISNAFKYSDANTQITCAVSETAEKLIIAIHNVGTPINKEDQKNIFRFLKTNAGREKSKNKSWGIGLALSRATVEGHGGSINVTSNAQDGTLFTIEIPKLTHRAGDRVTVKI